MGLFDDFERLADFANKAKEGLAHATTEKGEAKVLGRTFRYEMEGYMYKWELHYKAVVEDLDTEVRGAAKNYLGRFTSLRYALIDMLTQLKEKGVIEKNVDLQATAAATADCLDDPSTCPGEADSPPEDTIKAVPPAPQSQRLSPPAPHSTPSSSQSVVTPSQPLGTDDTAGTNTIAPSSEVSPLDHAQVVDSFIAPSNATVPAVGIGMVCVAVTIAIWYCRRRGVISARWQPVSAADKRPSIEDIPSLVELHSFPSARGNINIPEQISTNYKSFGIVLLNDHTGAVVDGIAHKHLKNPTQINFELLQKWRKGDGRRPVTWSTLIACLRDTGHSVLADDIHHALMN